MRVVAAVGTGSILGAEVAARPGRGGLGAGAATVGGESIDRSGQRVPSSPAVVRPKRDGRVDGCGFCGSGKGSTVSLPGSGSGTSRGTVPALAAEVEGSVQCAVRCAALRPDQHLCGGGSGAESESQARLQPG